jgi:hypothetical protein
MTDTRHDADEVIGRITTRGQWDRRYAHSYRDEIPPAIIWPEPEYQHPLKLIGVIVAQVLLLLARFVGLGMWAWIAWAAS